MKKLITVADWVNDSLTCQEFTSALEGYLKDASIYNLRFISSTPSTIHTGYLIAQIVETEERLGRPQDTVVFQNTDPRLQGSESLDEAKGAEFLIVKLDSGVLICGPNAGNNYSAIKHKIAAAFHYPGLDKGTQFRSRDLYPRVCAHLMDEMEDDLDLEEIHSNEIPELRGWYVGHIDNYGNIKTNIPLGEIKGTYEYGDLVKITIAGMEKKAHFVPNLFGGISGELVIYPGSSGVVNNPFLEISVWRHFTEKDSSTGAQVFQNPKPGTEILLRL